MILPIIVLLILVLFLIVVVFDKDDEVCHNCEFYHTSRCSKYPNPGDIHKCFVRRGGLF